MPRRFIHRFMHRFVELCALIGLLLLLQYPLVTRTLWNWDAALAIKNQGISISSQASSSARLEGVVVLPAIHRPLITAGESQESDFGGLELNLFQNATNTFRRRINPRDEENYQHDRIALFELMDQEQPWELSTNWLKNEDQIAVKSGTPDDCQAPSWRSLVFPTCNTVHEFTSNVLEKKLLGAGTSRMGWLVTPNQDHDEEFVLKQLILHSESRNNNDPPDKHPLKNQRETLIMERLTSSPRVVDITALAARRAL